MTPKQLLQVIKIKIQLIFTGTLKKFYIKSTSKEAILKHANSSSLGVFVDDPKGISGISDIFVDFYNEASKSTISRGLEYIHSGLMLTSNTTVSATSR